MPADIFRDVPFKDLYSFIGANCYQYALGIAQPVLVRTKNAYAFLNMIPGNANGASLLAPDYRSVIVAGCLSDGAIDLGQNLSFKPRYRTVALSFTSIGHDNDFHFTIIDSQGSVEDKLNMSSPRRRIVQSKNPADFQRNRNYRHDRFLQLPQGRWPQWLSRLDPTPLRIPGNKNTEFDCLIVEGSDENMKAFQTGLYLSPRNNMLLTLHASARDLGFVLHGAWYVLPIPERYRRAVAALPELPRCNP